MFRSSRQLDDLPFRFDFFFLARGGIMIRSPVHVGPQSFQRRFPNLLRCQVQVCACRERVVGDELFCYHGDNLTGQ